MLPTLNIPRKSETVFFTIGPPLFHEKWRRAVTPELMIDVEGGLDIPSGGGDPRWLEPPWERPVSCFQHHQSATSVPLRLASSAASLLL